MTVPETEIPFIKGVPTLTFLPSSVRRTWSKLTFLPVSVFKLGTLTWSPLVTRNCFPDILTIANILFLQKSRGI